VQNDAHTSIEIASKILAPFNINIYSKRERQTTRSRIACGMGLDGRLAGTSRFAGSPLLPVYSLRLLRSSAYFFLKNRMPSIIRRVVRSSIARYWMTGGEVDERWQATRYSWIMSTDFRPPLYIQVARVASPFRRRSSVRRQTGQYA